MKSKKIGIVMAIAAFTASALCSCAPNKQEKQENTAIYCNTTIIYYFTTNFCVFMVLSEIRRVT